VRADSGRNEKDRLTGHEAPMFIKSKLLNNILVKQIQHVKKTIRHYIGCISRKQAWSDICKLMNLMQHINRIKDKSHMIISVDAQKVFDKPQHPFMIKALKKLIIFQHNKGYM
jgi:hypothetical protein